MEGWRHVGWQVLGSVATVTAPFRVPSAPMVSQEARIVTLTHFQMRNRAREITILSLGADRGGAEAGG